MRSKGVHIWEGRPGFITTAHTDADLARVVDAFTESLAEMQQAGFLPAARESAGPPVPGARRGKRPDGREALVPARSGPPGQIPRGEHRMSADRPEASRPRLTPVDFDPFAGERDQVVLPLTAPQQEVWTAAQMGRRGFGGL